MRPLILASVWSRVDGPPLVAVLLAGVLLGIALTLVLGWLMRRIDEWERQLEFTRAIEESRRRQGERRAHDYARDLRLAEAELGRPLLVPPPERTNGTRRPKRTSASP